MSTATISVIVSGGVGALGLVVGALGTWFGVKAQRAEGRESREHERQLALAERLFDRRAVAYEALVGFCQAHLQTIESRLPAISPSPTPGRLYSDKEREEILGCFSTWGSRDAQDKLDSFLHWAASFHVHASLFELGRDQGADDLESLEIKMNDARNNTRTAFLDLMNRIRGDLAAP
jgi:hypothetical protein